MSSHNRNTKAPEKPKRRLNTAVWILAFLLLTFNLLFFGFDAYPIVERKLARVGIGTLTEQEFEQKAVERGLQMLVNPSPQPSEESSYLLFDYFLRPNRLVELSPLAILAAGVTDLAEHSNDPSGYISALEAYAASQLDGAKTLKTLPHNVETACQGSPLMYLATVTQKPEYIDACRDIAGFYKRSYDSTRQAIPYATNAHDKFVLVDTLGLMCPFLARYGAQMGDATATELAIYQFEDYLARGMHWSEGLPFHGYNQNKANGHMGALAWGRGSAWFALGLQELVRWLPKNHSKKKAFEDLYKSYATTIISKQRDNGSWGISLNADASAEDMSATAMLCHFLLYGRINGLLGPEYDEHIASGLSCLRANTRRDGTLDFCQGPARVQGLSSTTSSWGPHPYGQGALLSCIALLDSWRELQNKEKVGESVSTKLAP